MVVLGVALALKTQLKLKKNNLVLAIQWLGCESQ